jgi:hypothetical protein
MHYGYFFLMKFWFNCIKNLMLILIKNLIAMGSLHHLFLSLKAMLLSIL